MLQLVEDSKEAGIKTLVALDEQGEQLNRIEEDMDKINADMREAERAITGMEQCCGLFTCPCGKKSDFKANESTWKSSEDRKVINGQPARSMDVRDGGGPVRNGPYISRITNDAREDEMEENLVGVSSVLGNLRNMAIDMGSEIGSQNVQLERINLKADSNKSRIQGAAERTQKLLK